MRFSLALPSAVVTAIEPDMEEVSQLVSKLLKST